jgi:hypothetical protein
MGEKKPDYYVVATYGPYTRGEAQNKKWDLETDFITTPGGETIGVTIKHAAD